MRRWKVLLITVLMVMMLTLTFGCSGGEEDLVADSGETSTETTTETATETSAESGSSQEQTGSSVPYIKETLVPRSLDDIGPYFSSLSMNWVDGNGRTCSATITLQDAEKIDDKETVYAVFDIESHNENSYPVDSIDKFEFWVEAADMSNPLRGIHNGSEGHNWAAMYSDLLDSRRLVFKPYLNEGIGLFVEGILEFGLQSTDPSSLEQLDVSEATIGDFTVPVYTLRFEDSSSFLWPFPVVFEWKVADFGEFQMMVAQTQIEPKASSIESSDDAAMWFNFEVTDLGGK